MYDAWLFLHIAAAIVWVGGATALGLLNRRLERAQAGPALGAVGQQMSFFSTAVFMPVSLLAVASGFALVFTGEGWRFEDLWIALGIVGFLVTLAVGMGVLGPTARKITALVGDKGPQDPEVVALRGRMTTFTRVNEVVLWLVVLDMVVKPGA